MTQDPDPHEALASIQAARAGIGRDLAASLQAASVLPNVPMHEYQHSVFDRHLPLLRTTMRCNSSAV